MILLYKILIADRDLFETNGMKWMLQSSNSSYIIDTALDEKELIWRLEQDRPHILILELDMISENYLPILLKSVSILHPSIIALTIESTFEQAKKAINLGVRDLLLKPIVPERITRLVEKVIRENLFSEPKNDRLPKGKSDSELEYQQLFLDKYTKIDDSSFIGIGTEKAENLPSLLDFLKLYPFQNKPIFFPLSNMILAIVKSPSSFFVEEWKRFLQDANEKNGNPVVIIINEIKKDKISVQEKYQETIKLMDVTFFIGYHQVVHFIDSMNWNFIDPFLTHSEQSLWVEYLSQGKKQEIRDWIYKEFLEFKTPYPDPGLIRIRLTSILAQIRRHMKSFLPFIEELEKQYLDLFHLILYSPLIYQIVQEIILFTTEVIDRRKFYQSPKKDLLEKCLEYMENQFSDRQLSLEKMAQIVGRNSTYLSTVFVKKTGQTFRENLSEIRIKNAKNLLCDTDKSMKEIAVQCGFSNQQYFNRVFRKIYGTTPKEYRLLSLTPK